MAVSCGGILCGVAFFVGFLLLSEMIESSSEMETPPGADPDFGGVVFTGGYTFSSYNDDQSSEDRKYEGRCQLRGLAKSTGAADISVTNLEVKLRHASVESELVLHSGLLLESDGDKLEYFGTGATHPFMFSIAGSEESCLLDEVKFVFTKPQGGTAMTSVGEIVSSACQFRIVMELEQVNIARLKRKIVNYSILNNAVTLGLIKLYIDQIRILDSNANFSRVALAGIIIQSIADSLDSMLNFFIGLSVQFLFNIFIIIALFKFILFSFFEMRVIILAWRQVNANEINSLDPYDAAHAERNWIQTRMYLPMICCLVLIMLYPQYAITPLMLLSQLFWVPQIILDAAKGHKTPLTMRFIVGVSVLRLILPLYVWGCPSSIFNGEVIPQPTGGAVIAAIAAILQLVLGSIVATQKLFGPRWFVPWICLPHVYNYYRKIDLDEEFGVPECVVCMSEIEIEKDRKNTVITPCGHLFHTECLGEWMNLRQECPLCRRELPPIT